MAYSPPMQRLDPRVFQITFLSLLLGFGIVARDFGVSLLTAVAVLIVATGTQLMWVWAGKAKADAVWSGLISALSILLLCRANSIGLICVVAVVAISSKYVFRVHGKHFVNPTNFGILAVLLLTHRVWVSPGQWGSEVVMAAWIGVLGLVVVLRSARMDTAFLFLAGYGLLLSARVLYLGQPWAVLTHQLSSGTVILFSFFMISDPRSTPDDRRGRAVFAASIAIFTYYLRFFQQVSAAPLWALFFLSPLTLVLDRIWRHERFNWRGNHAKNSLGSTGHYF